MSDELRPRVLFIISKTVQSLAKQRQTGDGAVGTNLRSYKVAGIQFGVTTASDLARLAIREAHSKAADLANPPQLVHGTVR